MELLAIESKRLLFWRISHSCFSLGRLPIRVVLWRILNAQSVPSKSWFCDYFERPAFVDLLAIRLLDVTFLTVPSLR